MKSFTKALSLVVCFILLFSCFSTVFATENTEQVSGNLQVEVVNGKTRAKVSGLESNCIGKTVMCGWYKDERLVDFRFGIYNGEDTVLTSEVVDVVK